MAPPDCVFVGFMFAIVSYLLVGLGVYYWRTFVKRGRLR
jgi:hypothetical protein